MVHSLRLRLLLTMIAVVLATAGTVALVAQQSALSEFQRFIEINDKRSQQLGQLFQQASQLNGLDGPARQAAIMRMATESGEHIVLADAGGRVVADSAGSSVGRMAHEIPLDGTVLLQLTDQAIVSSQPSSEIAITSPSAALRIARFDQSIAIPGERAIAPPDVATDSLFVYTQVLSGSLTFGEPRLLEIAPAQVAVTWPGVVSADPVGAGFASGLNRSLITAMVVAGVVALILTWLLSRQIIKPVEELTQAAERMAHGDLAHRVVVSSHDEIGGLGRAFNTMAATLQRAEELRRTMVGDIAHELRTPLTNIQGYLEAMRDGLARADRPMIDSLYEEALLLNRLIEDLQDLTLAEAGQLRLVRTPTDLGALIAHAARVIQPQMGAKGIALRVELPTDMLLLSIDSERIGQVIRNLLNNALTHTAAGGCVIVRAAYSVQTGDNRMVTISVEDTGCGIATNDIPLIFERFYRADRSRNRATGGSGLGLTIVRQLVEAHGGVVSVKSQLGVGSCFSFTL